MLKSIVSECITNPKTFFYFSEQMWYMTVNIQSKIRKLLTLGFFLLYISTGVLSPNLGLDLKVLIMSVL